MRAITRSLKDQTDAFNASAEQAAMLADRIAERFEAEHSRIRGVADDVDRRMRAMLQTLTKQNDEMKRVTQHATAAATELSV
ncbi:MAG: hypothetical protein FJX52_14390 [Alphaproteobacteria bacterium]|nr:hypothetical protein [Alphaproteobacteria bacterium]